MSEPDLNRTSEPVMSHTSTSSLIITPDHMIVFTPDVNCLHGDDHQPLLSLSLIDLIDQFVCCQKNFSTSCEVFQIKSLDLKGRCQVMKLH